MRVQLYLHQIYFLLPCISILVQVFRFLLLHSSSDSANRSVFSKCLRSQSLSHARGNHGNRVSLRLQQLTRETLRFSAGSGFIVTDIFFLMTTPGTISNWNRLTRTARMA